ncbi:MAG: 30S ribosomal protein S16 [Candidatus Taylorbacteria bacterium]|nr:30S ribosomal protein S16 [Candidatus Taylorbacteria bacterium]
MLKIRLQRVGRKNIATFRVVLTESQNSTKSGKYLEVLGSYDPVHKVKEVDADRIKYWISKGAQPSETLHNFFIDKKIIAGKKLNVLPAKKSIPKRKEAKAAPAEKKTAPAPAASSVSGTDEKQTA